MRLLIIIFIVNFTVANAKTVGKSTGFELPRFVSTKTEESNLRVGASLNYPIKIQYIIKNFPLEIIDEHEDWRKVKDKYANKLMSYDKGNIKFKNIMKNLNIPLVSEN